MRIIAGENPTKYIATGKVSTSGKYLHTFNNN